jgi:hypothetical protein
MAKLSKLEGSQRVMFFFSSSSILPQKKLIFTRDYQIAIRARPWLTHKANFVKHVSFLSPRDLGEGSDEGSYLVLIPEPSPSSGP